jgi:hypothetical protein
MAELTLTAAAAIAATAIGTGVSVYGQTRAAEASKKAEEARNRMEKIRAQRERQEQIRQARIKRAQIVQAAENQGAGGSSSAITGASGVVAQAESNIQYINAQTSIGKQISNAQASAVGAQGISAIGEGIAAIGSTIFANSSEIESIFKKKKNPVTLAPVSVTQIG